MCTVMGVLSMRRQGMPNGDLVWSDCHQPLDRNCFAMTF